jgi:prophage DNA circulation protein
MCIGEISYQHDLFLFAVLRHQGKILVPQTDEVMFPEKMPIFQLANKITGEKIGSPLFIFFTFQGESLYGNNAR